MNEVTLRDYLRVAWSGRWLILIATVVGIVVGILLSVARSPEYTATARVYLGQATTIAGVPVQTPFTNPTVAPLALDSDAIVRKVADAAGVSPSRVRSAVTLSAPRVNGTAGNLPTILTVTSTDKNRKLAVEIANAYADNVLEDVSTAYRETRKVYEGQVARSRQEVDGLIAEAAKLRARLASAPAGQADLIQLALTSAVQQLDDARQQADDDEVLLRKADQVEAPQALTQAERASSSGTGPKRVQSIVLAGLIAFALGVLATFVWRGSPAARAADAGRA
ncbi:MAG: Wzz/FepE/Etk N-terminal domain-containing protein [Thermoleophilia bacterium]